VRELVRKTTRPVLDICHAVVALVEAGAVAVVQPPAAVQPGASHSRSAGGKASRPVMPTVVDPETPYGPGVESPQGGPGSHGEDEEQVAGKGQYLRVFSALRDT
jgi:hypothetical protein